MTNPTMDIRIVAGIALIAVGILVGEEALSFVLRRVARRAGAAPSVTRDIGATLRIVALVLILFNALSYAGLSSLFTGLTVSAIAALVVSLALQTTLANIISGILLLSDGVLRLGDTIEFQGSKGEVVRIGLRSTWIRDTEGHITVISNSSLSGGPLVNHTGTERLSKRYSLPKDDGPALTPA